MSPGFLPAAFRERSAWIPLIFRPFHKLGVQDAFGELQRWRVGRESSPITCVLSGPLLEANKQCCVAITVDGSTTIVSHNPAPEPGKSSWTTAAADQVLTANVQHAVIAEVRDAIRHAGQQHALSRQHVLGSSVAHARIQVDSGGHAALVVGTSDGRVEAYTFSGEGDSAERSQLQRGAPARLQCATSALFVNACCKRRGSCRM